ncbi:MAG: DUF4973 domain-containing protein [Dysgonomonas sp.]|nr:DUF4973 domain-containing protein [Dysgonomonas sp.]
MKKIYNLFLIITACLLCWSCNNEWEEEQYVHWVSFKTTINSQGVSPVYVRYKPEGKVTFQLPLIVSGSLMNNKDLSVQERFGSRTELYYKELESKHFEFPETVNIPSGESTALLPIDFSLKDLDMVDKWMLPITILSDPSYNYEANLRRHYCKALLRVLPFNDYSGEYSATTYKVYFKENENEAIVPDGHTAYVVDDKTVFFYAGLVDEERLDRAHYKVFFEFTDEAIDPYTNKLNIYTDNSQMNLVVNGQPTYEVEEKMDATKPYLKIINVTLNMEYTYQDYTSVPNYVLDYIVKGTLILERRIDTRIPDEDQAIQW